MASSGSTAAPAIVAAIVGERVIMGHNVWLGQHVQIGHDCTIGHNVVIGDYTVMGNGNTVGNFTNINAGTAHHHVTIGHRNRIGEFVNLGATAPSGHHEPEQPHGSTVMAPGGGVVIGNDNTIHSRVTVLYPTTVETRIGHRCQLLTGTLVSHDVLVEDDVTVSAQCSLSGHSRLMAHCTVGVQSSTHQHTVIGSYAMIGMGSAVRKHVPPFSLIVATDQASCVTHLNTVGLQRHQVVLGSHVSRLAHCISRCYATHDTLDTHAMGDSHDGHWRSVAGQEIVRFRTLCAAALHSTRPVYTVSLKPSGVLTGTEAVLVAPTDSQRTPSGMDDPSSSDVPRRGAE